MKHTVWLCIAVVSCLLSVFAQRPETAASAANAAVPTLVKFSGTLVEVNDKPLTSVVGVTFSLYKDSEGGAPLWMETQNVQLDKTGHYSVMLGSTTSQGLPAHVFAHGEARWLGVQAQGHVEQPRVLLLSVPYALKALDAETIGGKPVSSFQLVSPQSKNGNGGAPPPADQANEIRCASGTGCKVNFIPVFASNGGSAKVKNSIMFQTGGKLGVGTTSPTAELESMVAGEGTLALRLDSGPNSFLDITPTHTGGRFQTVLNTVNNRDVVILPGTTGRVGIGTTSPNAELESVVASEGTLALRLDSGPNSFLDITPFKNGSRFQTQLSTVNNRDLIFLPGTGNVGVGQTSPTAKLEVDAAGEGSLAVRLDSGPNAFLDITPTNTGGRFQTVLSTVNNRDLILLPGTTSGVGIGTTSPAHTLEVVAGGTTLADAWTVRSSRRFKTNIQPLEGALEKVEQLQGVSYERKSDGKHEIGVIAEDVDQIVPEVVSRSPKTKEVQGVDYARLAALLIEAVKSQQAEIQELKAQIGQLTSNPAGQ
jgi:hypothetical protein